MTASVTPGNLPSQSLPPTWNLDQLVSDLRQSREITHNIRHNGHIHRTPSLETLALILDNLSTALFPSHYGQIPVTGESIDYVVGGALNRALPLLAEQIARSLAFAEEETRPEPLLRDEAQTITRDFASRLPALRGVLVGDLRAAFQSDPAATSFPEVLLGYPGMIATVYYRLAHLLHRFGATVLARLISSLAHAKTGIDIHPGAEIGPSFFIDHGTGVVIGETAIIGERVRLHQAVTLGAPSALTDETGRARRGGPRHPIIEDDVIVYAGATILGRVTIGRGSVIGGNVWLTRSVPAGSQISQAYPRSNGAV